MEIKIEQKFFAIIRDKYSITSNNSEIFTAKSSIIHKPFKPKIFFFDRNKKHVLTMIRASPAHPEYDLYFSTGEKSGLRVSDMFNYRYELTYQNDLYEFVGHQWRLASFLKNGTQIGWFKEESWEDEYLITADDNANQLILIAMVIAYDFHFRKGNNIEVHNRGKIGWKMPHFDEDGKPNSNLSFE